MSPSCAIAAAAPIVAFASPSNNQELIGAMNYLFKNPQPSYLRLDKSLDLNSVKKVTNIKPGKWIFYKNKKNKNLIISTGTVVDNCQKIAKSKKNYDWATIPMWSMKSKKSKLAKMKKYNNILSVENHLQDGGFGSWLNESLAQEKKYVLKTKFSSKFISSKVIGKVGSENYLNKKYGPK